MMTKLRNRQEEATIMMGLFEDLFDFNGNGELDAFERGAEFAFLEELENEDEEDEDTNDYWEEE